MKKVDMQMKNAEAEKLRESIRRLQDKRIHLAARTFTLQECFLYGGTIAGRPWDTMGWDGDRRGTRHRQWDPYRGGKGWWDRDRGGTR